VLGEWALSIVGVEEGREFRFRGDLYSQESTFPLVLDMTERILIGRIWKVRKIEGIAIETYINFYHRTM